MKSEGIIIVMSTEYQYNYSGASVGTALGTLHVR